MSCEPQLQFTDRGFVVDALGLSRYSEEVLVMVVLHDFHQLTLSFWNYYLIFFLFENKKDWIPFT